jgi:hypothetical protein
MNLVPHIAIAAATLTFACGGGSSEATRTPQPTAAPVVSALEREQVIAQASAAIMPFKKKLLEALTGAISQGGPVAAIDVCS